MIIVNILQCILYLLVVPFGLGLLFEGKKERKYNTLGIIYTIGFLTELGIFQVIFLIAFFLIGNSFTPVVYLSSVCLVVPAIFSLIFKRKSIKKIYLPEINFGFIVFVLFVVYMVVMRNSYGVNDGDDAFVLGNALTTLTTGRMYEIDYYTGLSINEYSRHFLASSPLFIAFVSKVSFIHPTVLAHRILGSLYLCVYASIIYNIGSVLLEDSRLKNYRGFFSSLVMLLTIWDFHSPYTSSTFILTRTWQGKAMFCEIAIPFSILLLLMYGKNIEKQKNNCLIMAVLCVASVAMTPGAIFMLPLLLFVGSVFVSICQKKFRLLIGTCLSLSVMAVFAVIYVLF